MLVRLDEFSHLADSVSGLKMFVIFRKLSSYGVLICLCNIFTEYCFF